MFRNYHISKAKIDATGYYSDTPEKMLNELKALSNDEIDAWIHSAAVLDYVVESPAEGKLASQQGPLNVKLVESPKHILELKDKCKDSVELDLN